MEIHNVQTVNADMVTVDMAAAGTASACGLVCERNKTGSSYRDFALSLRVFGPARKVDLDPCLITVSLSFERGLAYEKGGNFAYIRLSKYVPSMKDNSIISFMRTMNCVVPLFSSGRRAN
jgi:hypothetical protein